MDVFRTDGKGFSVGGGELDVEGPATGGWLTVGSTFGIGGAIVLVGDGRGTGAGGGGAA